MPSDNWSVIGTAALAVALLSIAILLLVASLSHPARAVRPRDARAGSPATPAQSTTHPRERPKRRRDNGQDRKIRAEADHGVPGIGSRNTTHTHTTTTTTTTEAGCPVREQDLLAERSSARVQPAHNMDARRPDRRPKADSATARTGRPPHHAEPTS